MMRMGLDKPASAIALSLLEVCAHGGLSNIGVTVGHSNLSKVLLLDVLTSCSKLCNLAKTGSLRTDHRCWSKPQCRRRRR